jgi:predicted P-loop ATPase
MLISVSALVGTRSEPRELAWQELAAWLGSCAPGVVPRKDDVTLFTLTDAGAGVQDSEVRAVWGVGLDYDGTTPAQMAQAIAAARALGCGCAYTTHSNGVKLDPKRPEATERFRIFLPFDRPLEGAELRQWKQVWKVVAEAVGRFHPKKAPGVAESNIGRRWYVPASNPLAPSPCRFEAWDGLPLALDVVLEASRGVAPAVAVVDELDLEQGEAVGRAELVKLAASLVRRKSEEHQRVGRALQRMVEGQGFGASRGATQWQVAGEIAQAYPFANAAYIADLLRPALEADGPPTDDFADQLRRQQAAKQTEIAERRALLDAFPKPETPGAKPGTPAALGQTAAHVAASIGLRLDERGKIANNMANVTAILTGHPEWSGVIGFNELAQRTEARREPPMRPIDTPAAPCAGPWTDVHTSRVQTWIFENFGFEPSRQAADNAIEQVAHMNPFHPIRDYLRTLTWDGVPRLDLMLTRYLGATDTPYVRSVGAKSMIGAVARAMCPGAKVDTMLILEGLQGTKKSTAIRTLAGGAYFADTSLDFESKDALQAIQGKWIYEIGELHGFNRTETTRLKAFLTAVSDNFRPAYGRRNADFPRQCVFWGTTNGTEYLTDTTGNRRFWPVVCGAIDLAALAADRDQLWAEALHRYAAGEPWWLEERVEVERAEAEQAARESVDTWEARIDTFVSTPYVPPGATEARLRDAFTMGEVLGYLGLETRDQAQAHSTRAGKILAKLGWRTARRRLEGGKVLRFYVRGGS